MGESKIRFVKVLRCLCPLLLSPPPSFLGSDMEKYRGVLYNRKGEIRKSSIRRVRVGQEMMSFGKIDEDIVRLSRGFHRLAAAALQPPATSRGWRHEPKGVQG